MFLVTPSVFAVVCLAMRACADDSQDAPVRLNSNAIKNLPDGVTGPSQAANPDLLPVDGGIQNIALDTLQTLTCANDQDCRADEFCNDSRRACLKCRRARRRCARDAMCCPGKQCVTGKCLPSFDGSNQHVGRNRTAERPPKVRTPPGGVQPLKGLEGESCLRSSDCAEGLCCARHFWARICKPVLRKGQVCSKHRRKGAQGVEIFQRCSCGDGLTCRALKGHHNGKATRRLNTCQRR